MKVRQRFSIEEIEKMGQSQFDFFYKEIVKEEYEKQIILRLDISECINIAYTGSVGGAEAGLKYKEYRESLIKKIDPDFLQRKANVFWDNMGKRSRKFK